MKTTTEQKNLESVLAQIEAFNAKDIEGSLKYWSDDLNVISMPDGRVVFANKQEVREHLQRQFGEGVDPVSRVLEQRAEGDYVYMLEEKETSDGSVVRKRYTYLVEDGLIRKMWAEPAE